MDYMTLAAELARKGEGFVEPNPCVGAVVVRNGKIVGKGFHKRFGGPHAEVYALEQAGSRAKDGSMYVTLEPCCHQGKTPPCTRAIIAAGVGEVIAACKDPNQLVGGKGIRELKRHGIRVRLQPIADNPALPFLRFHASGLPYVTAKWAMTADGKLATETGDSKWITSEEARRFARNLRFKSQAVVVGANTVRRDDPHLLPEPFKREFWRVIVTASGNIPERSFVVKSAREFRTLIIGGGYADSGRLARLEKRGCVVRTTEVITARAILEILAGMNIIKVFVEGGRRTLVTFFDEGFVNEAHVFVGPKIIGTRKKQMSQASSFKLSGSFKIGTDLCMVIKRET